MEEASSGSRYRGTVAKRLALYQHQLARISTPSPTTRASNSNSVPSNSVQSSPPNLRNAEPAMARDPITCHVLNTLTGTPAANLPVTLSLLSTTTSTFQNPQVFTAVTDADGRVKIWTPTAVTSTALPDLLSSLPAADSKTNWALRFEVGPWYEAQGVETFWPDIEVKFTVKGRGREEDEGWRHYHVPVLLGPWNYSTYRGS